MVGWVLLVALALQDAPQERVLVAGATLEGRVDASSAVVDSPALRQTAGPSPGVHFALRVDQAGPYHVDLRSDHFDTYLVLRDGAGNVLAEDDDGLVSLNSRIVFELLPGESYQVDAVALSGGEGLFRITLEAGAPRTLTGPERARADLEEATARVDRLRALEGRSPALAIALDALATALESSGEYEPARGHYEEALAVREAALGKDHFLTASSLNNLAVLLLHQERSAQALPLLERTLAISRAAQDPSFLAMVLHNLAASCSAQGDRARALDLYEEALALYESRLGPDHPETVGTLGNLGTLRCQMGDWERGLPDLRRVVAACEATLGPDHLVTAARCNNLAAAHRDRGELAAAAPLYERALVVFEAQHGPAHPETATVLDNLGVLRLLQGDYAAARRLCERALTVREARLGPDDPHVAMSLNNLASILEDLGDHEGASALYRRSLAIREAFYGEGHPRTARALVNLALALHDAGRRDEALPLAERAATIHEASGDPLALDAVQNLNLLAVLVQAQGETEAAQALLERSLRLCESSPATLRRLEASSAHHLATLHFEQGRTDEARASWERALAANREAIGDAHPEAVRLSNVVAQHLLELGAVDEARDLLVRADEGRRRHLAATLLGLSEAESFLYLASLRGQLELLLGAANDEPSSTRAYEALLAWKGQVLRTALRRAHWLDRLQPEVVGPLARLQEVDASLSALALGRLVSPDDLRPERLSALQHERERLERDLAAALEAPADERAPTWDELRASLPPDSALVDVFVRCLPRVGGAPADGSREFWSEPHVCAWITRPDAEHVLQVDLGPAERLERAVQAALTRLAEGRGERLETPGTDETLRALLWEPLLPHVGDADPVFVSPDGVLATLPFEILRLADGRSLVEERGFVYVADATGLARRVADSARPPDSLLVLGGVDYDLRGDGDDPTAHALSARPSASSAAGALRSLQDDWLPLEWSRAEARAVLRAHETVHPDGRRLLLSGAEATEERLKAELPRHRVAHLATHGFFAPEGSPSLWQEALDAGGQPALVLRPEARRLVGLHPGLLSGVVCAGANRDELPGAADGLFTAAEAAWLDLSGVDLVVLSACETGLGRPQSGEGLVGLRRALLGAGARTVVSSLWRVSDESTERLMRSFYRHLWDEGRGRHEALRAAQLELLRENRVRHGDARPWTWGAFVLDGEWR